MAGNKFKFDRTYVGNLPAGADLYESLTAVAHEENIRAGRITGIGAVTHAVVSYYDQASRKYGSVDIDHGMEILSLVGNISIKDGKPFVHAHITLADHDGRAFGGHLMPGTLVFVFEVFIDVFKGEDLVRTPHEETGLALWQRGDLLVPARRTVK